MTFIRSVMLSGVALFFVLTAWFGRPAGLWNSPDETANAFWAERVAHLAPLRVPDAIVGLGAGAVHPRSMAVAGDALVPGSFPGLFLLYGGLRLLLKLPLFLFTPLFTAAAGVCFGALIARLFDRRTGLIAGALFFLHPAVMYYAARGLFHNVLFADLLVLSAACFALRKSCFWDVVGGFLFGWAIAVRTSEAIWAVPAFLAFLPFTGAERWRRLGRAALGVFLPLLLLLSVNADLYGSPFKTPYVAVSDNVAPEAHLAPGAEPAAPQLARDAFRLPFGFDAKRVLRNAWEYGFGLFWWQSFLALAGFMLWLFTFRASTSAQKMYALAAVATAAWLAVLYGSWEVRDRFDPASVTIGTSYVRYFLPAYVAMIPFAALALARLGDKLERARVASVAVLAVVGALTIRSVVFSGDESLLAVRATLAQNAVKRQALLRLFPPDAVVMTERFDKLIVPERLRVIPLADRAGFQAAALAVRAAPVYWYGLTPSDDEMARLEALAGERNLNMVQLPSPVAGESAYFFELGSAEGGAEADHEEALDL